MTCSKSTVEEAALAWFGELAQTHPGLLLPRLECVPYDRSGRRPPSSVGTFDTVAFRALARERWQFGPVEKHIEMLGSTRGGMEIG